MGSVEYVGTEELKPTHLNRAERNMESTMESHNGDATPQSVQASWQYCKEVLSASSTSDAWRSFKKMMEALPAWALVVVIVGVFALMTNAWIVLVPLAAGSVLAGIYFTVKHAVRAALREHDSQRQH
jgi:hypothetical protein